MITKLDVLDSLASIKICTGYRQHDTELDHPPANIAILGQVEPQSSNGHLALRTSEGGALLQCERPTRERSGDAAVSIRTVYPELLRQQPAGDVNVWPATVSRRVFLGDSVQYFVAWVGGVLSVRKLPIDLLDEGEQVFVRIDPKHCVFVD